MLKVITLLDCNTCGLAIEQAPVVNLLDVRDWQSAGYTMMAELKDTAEAQGWLFRDNQMVCGCCQPEGDEQG
jgi:hypothetical protein